jgi:hypothetical protein
MQMSDFVGPTRRLSVREAIIIFIRARMQKAFQNR